MAEVLLRKRLADTGLASAIEVQSAGVFAQEGQAASRQAGLALAGRNVSLDGHLSQPITIELLKRASLVLVMEEGHRRSLFYFAPQYLSKVFLLAEMASRHDDIPDPYGGPFEGYVRTVGKLEELLDAGWPAILQRLGITSESNTSVA
jgi:protein-tyrosine-phosphatase